ncbi:MAG: histidine kinase, partial [Dehalococcoidia bacterium]
SREELLDTPVSAIHPLEMPRLMAFADSVFQEGHGWSNELTCLTKGGDYLPTEISGSVVSIEDRDCIIAIVRDITERNQAEKRLHEQMRDLAVAEERNRLAREIHDTLAQGFTGIIWQLNAMERTLTDSGPKALEHLSRIRDLARDSLQEARRSVWDLRAGPLEGKTLSEALQEETEKLSNAENIRTSVAVQGPEKVLSMGIESALLRIGQESLTNVLKYARATEVSVILAFADSSVTLTVRDNGVGFDPESPTPRSREGGGFGLINMRERVRVLGGELKVQSAPGQGTLVEASLSLN